MKNENKGIGKMSILIGSIFFVFLGGMIAGAAMTDDQTTTQPEIKEIVREVEVQTNNPAWQKLKTIDDEIIQTSITQSELSGAAMYAIANNDVNTVELVTTQVKENNLKFQKQLNSRQEILNELGY